MEFAMEHDRLCRDVKRRAEGGSLPYTPLCGVQPRSIPVRPRLRPRRGLKWRVGSRVFNLAGKACRAWLHPRARRPLPPDLPRFRVA